MTLIKQKQVKNLETDLAGKLPLAGGTMTGDIVLAGDPIAVLHPATKQYVDNKVASSVDYKGGYDASTNTPDLDTSPSGVKKGDMYTVTVAGTFFSTAVEVGDVLIAEIDNANAEADWTIVNKNLDASSIKTAYESNSNTNAYTDAEKTKVGYISVTQAVDLDQIESDTATNNAKQTNATHTGEVTGSGVLTVQPTAISNKTSKATPAGTEEVLINDGGTLKKTTTQAIADLGGGNVSIIEEDDTCPTTNASTNFNITLTSAPTGGIAGIVSICINGISLSASELISVSSTTVTINVPYAVDSTDTVTTRYF